MKISNGLLTLWIVSVIHEGLPIINSQETFLCFLI